MEIDEKVLNKVMGYMIAYITDSELIMDLYCLVEKKITLEQFEQKWETDEGEQRQEKLLNK